MVQVREVLRRWLSGNEGLRRVADAAGVDRKTARRYVEAAQSLGVKRDGGEPQLTDQVLAAVVDKVRPGRPAGHGEAWKLLESHHDVDLIVTRPELAQPGTWPRPALVGRSLGTASVTRARWLPPRAQLSAHGLLHKRGYPCLVGHIQLYESEGVRPHIAVI